MFTNKNQNKNMKIISWRTLLFTTMRITVTQIFLSILFVCTLLAKEGIGQELLEKRVTVNAKKIELNKLLQILNQQTGASFIYSSKVIKSERKISANEDNMRLAAFIDKYLTPLEVGYKLIDNQILLYRNSDRNEITNFSISEQVGSVNSANETIIGLVTDSSGVPLIGASVELKSNRKISVITDAKGQFTITVDKFPAVLVISYIGFQTREVIVNDNLNKLNVKLFPSSASEMDNIVVTAFGIKRDQKALGYASQKVSGQQLSAVGNTNIQNSLQGKAAGVQVRLSSGMPGRPALVNIRGSRSITGSNEPLYVIDGLPVAAGSRTIDFNPSDVENMDILKGPAAAALYGVRASNGVIVITTKSGKNANRKPVVTFESQFGQDKVSYLPKLQYEYAQGNNGVFDQNGLFSYGPQINTLGTYTNLLGEQEQGASYRNMDDFYGAGLTFNNNLEIAQGGNFGNYAIGVGRTDQRGVIANTDMQRTNLKFNGLMTPFKNLKIGISFNYADINVNDFPDEAGNVAFFRALYEAPPSYNLKGKPYASPANPYQQILFRAAQNNPYWILANNNRNSKTGRTYGNILLEYQLAKGLKANYRVGLDNFNTKVERYDELGTGPTGRTAVPSGGQFVLQNQQQSQLNSNFFLNYDRDLSKDLVLNFIAGNELFEIRNANSSISSTNFVTSNWKNVANGTTIISGNSKSAQRVVGFYGNANLGYKETVYLNLSARKDYASNLPSGNRSFLYPSAGLSFILTEAMPKLKNIFTFAKFRANYAEVGQLGQLYVNGVGYSASNPGYLFPLNGIAGFLPSGTNISPTLRPENTQSVEFGTEMRFLKNRIGIDYTYFRSLSDGQIFGIPLPPSTGFGIQVNNAGKMLSKGHEVMFRVTPLKTNNINWDLNINFSKYNTTIEELPAGLSRIELSNASGAIRLIAEKGQPYPAFLGSDYQVDPASGKRVISSLNGFPLGTPVAQVLGTPNPDFEFNFINTIRYKSLTLGFQVDWRKGGMFFSMLQNESRIRGLSAETLDRDINQVLPGKKGRFVNGALVIEGDNDISIKKTNPYWSNLPTIANLDDASFMRLREINLNYDMPNELVKKLKLSGLGIFFTGRNLFLRTKTFVDPELNMTNTLTGSSTGNSVGIEWYQQPQTRSIGAGLRLKF
jgi:TonB-linked SusC/RagA family outer membrane protein